jgi:hypothetical protein
MFVSLFLRKTFLKNMAHNVIIADSYIYTLFKVDIQFKGQANSLLLFEKLNLIKISNILYS